jgi:hypothetical protein
MTFSKMSNTQKFSYRHPKLQILKIKIHIRRPQMKKIRKQNIVKMEKY